MGEKYFIDQCKIYNYFINLKCSVHEGFLTVDLNCCISTFCNDDLISQLPDSLDCFSHEVDVCLCFSIYKTLLTLWLRLAQITVY